MSGIEADVPFHSRVIAVDGRPVTRGADVYDYVADLDWPGRFGAVNIAATTPP